MIDLHYWPTPNGHKITMFLEETGLDYKIFPVDIGTGEQFKPDFLAIAPNNRMPAIVDHAPKGGGAPIPAGLFRSENGQGIHFQPGAVDPASIAAIAVTLEPEAGSTTPTMPILIAAPVQSE